MGVGITGGNVQRAGHRAGGAPGVATPPWQLLLLLLLLQQLLRLRLRLHLLRPLRLLLSPLRPTAGPGLQCQRGLAAAACQVKDSQLLVGLLPKLLG